MNLDYVQREAGQATVSVVDLLGREVFSQSRDNSAGLQSFSFDLSVPAGVYTVQVRTAAGSVAQKLILN